jgi:hypothetical protein
MNARPMPRSHRLRAPAIGFAAALALAAAGAPPAGAAPDGTAPDTLGRPFVPGGYDDKPHLEGLFGRIALGGYVEAAGSWEREEGATSELGFAVRRWNLLAATDIRRRVQIWSELEFEDGGEEVRVELAQVDVRLFRPFSLRAGVLLLPLGRFNLAHDAPRNELPDRPAVADELLGVALSMPGLGGFGTVGTPAGARWTWEAYGITGYHDGLLLDSPDGTRLPAGRVNHEDANASPAWVGRIEWSPARGTALGASGYHGAYNRYRLDGLDVDARRDVAIGMVDAEATALGVTFGGEGTIVEVDLPPTLAGVFASRQGGAWLQASRVLARDLARDLPGSSLAVVARVEAVDFDRDRPGDSVRSIALGLAARPVPETALKLAWTRGETRDRFNNRAAFARLQLGLATYF